MLEFVSFTKDNYIVRMFTNEERQGSAVISGDNLKH